MLGLGTVEEVGGGGLARASEEEVIGFRQRRRREEVGTMARLPAQRIGRGEWLAIGKLGLGSALALMLVEQLSAGSQEVKVVATRELRLMAKIGKENRECPDYILNISIHDENKRKIMEENGCLELIVYVLRYGLTTEARENAAATLFSLSAVHDFKKMIVDEHGVVAALADLLMQGSPRGKKDAVMALFNLLTHPESWSQMLNMGAVSALAGALRDEIVAEEVAGALTLLMRHHILAQTIASEDTAITNLVGLMKRGTPKAKENAIAALQEMCRRGGLNVI
ncbi:hypothetical protein ZIOFF_072256 [Zingiber officinale]|uniref:U-box domain-containing protein n=1 Tax=Zingiber officinale TaxID=94328 RepID=A0A8J5C2X9_ZINOF|nr:hypothetical protein ZIOFF_072256 [Zingiber officinale]